MGSQAAIMFYLIAIFALGLAGQAQARHMGCYYGVWSYTRPGMGEFWPEDIDISLCDVIYYGFGNVLNDTFEVCSWDPWFDMDMQIDAGALDIPNCIKERDGIAWPPGCLTDAGLEYCHHNGMRRTIALKKKNPQLKVLFSVGGWTAGGWIFSQMAQTKGTRFMFIRSAIHFLNHFGFDGLDLDWEFPALDMLPEEPTDPNDKYHFTSLIQEMRAEFDKDGLLLTFAASPDPAKAKNAYELEKVHPYVDWINVMTYDYGGLWDKFTGIDAPLYGRWEEGFEGHPHYHFNILSTIEYYLSEGVPKEKLSLGIHTEAKGFLLKENKENGIYCPAAGSPNMTFSRQEGWLNYYEILQFFYNETIEDPLYQELGIKPGYEQWDVFTDGCYMAPFAHQGPLWISYDDEESVDLKARFANHHGLKGAFVWEIDTDNFMGKWGKEPYTITRAITKALESGKGLEDHEILGHAEENANCKPQAPLCDPTDYTPTIPTLSTIVHTTSAAPVPTTTTAEHDCDEVGCKEDGDLTPYPGDCHKYYKCVYDKDGRNCHLEGHTCGTWWFDPMVKSCGWEPLPGNDHLC